MSVDAQNFELRPVRGPSAVGGGWKRFGELLYLMSVTEFKKTYFGTILGYVWSLLRPLLLFAVLLFVFTKIVRIGSGVPHYPELLLMNVVLFGFFSESTQTSVMSVVTQEGVVRKTQFPRLVIPLSVVTTSLFNLGMNLIVVVVFLLAFGVEPQWTWLLFPFIVVTLFVYATAVSMLLSSLYVRFRDTAIIWSVVASALFYATPVIYPIEVVPERYRGLISLNPLTALFEQARKWVIDPSAPGAVSAVGGWTHLLPGIAIFLGTCVLGAWYFNREAPRIAEEL
jgi:ABC-2 type transport system permease protein